MTSPKLRAIALTTTIVWIGVQAGCGDPVTLVATFITITNTWEDVANPEHRFSFSSDDDGETQGVFTGTEFVNDADFEGFPLTGSWSHGRITFTVERDTGGVTFSGDIPADDLDQLTLSYPDGYITIRRQ